MKTLRVIGLAAILIGLIVSPIAAAPNAPPGKWYSDVTILNLETTEAQLQITRYGVCAASGCTADAGTVVTDTVIAGSGSLYYNPVNDSSFPSTFAGSFLLSADKKIAATVTTGNDQTGTAYASDAYPGIATPDDSVFLPIIMGKLGVWNTRMAIMNAGDANADITITYIGAGAPAATTLTAIPPKMTIMVDQYDNAGMTNFNGAASVTSNQPLAIVVDEYKEAGGVLVSYTGVPLADADTTIYMPGYIATGVWATDMTIVNTENASTQITITFAGVTNTVTGELAANGAAYINGTANIYPTDWTGTTPTSGYYAAATVESSDTNIVIVYNIANSGPGGPANANLGYVAFPAKSGKTNYAVPLLMNGYSTGWDTTFSVQSIDGTAATLTFDYSGSVTDPPAITMTGASQTFNQVTDGHVPAGYIGGVNITSDKAIVVIADQNHRTITGDSAAGFPGIAP